MPVSRKRKRPPGPGARPHRAKGGAWPFVTMVGFAVLLGGATWFFMGATQEDLSTPVTVPALGAKAAEGRVAFARVCAACHGKDGSGGGGGPPLIHRIYNPGRHADGAFRLAIMRGTRQHDWTFGDMPPQPSIEAAEVEAIIAFIRQVQKANGVY